MNIYDFDLSIGLSVITSVCALIFVYSLIPMAESFVAVCDMRLKFHNLPAKFACNFNE